MNKLKLVLPVFFVLFTFTDITAQCANPQLITWSNVNDLTHPYQLTFLHPVPKNKVDSALIIMMTPTKHLIDYQALLTSVARTKSEEAFQFFYVMLMHRPSAIDDLTLMFSISSIVNEYGGAELLDKYFLDEKESKRLIRETGKVDKESLRAAVLLAAAKKVKPIYFCLQRATEFTREQMQSIINAAFNEYIPCEQPIPVTHKNILEIQNPYEFTFLHKAPQNLTDSCILRFIEGPFDADVKPMLERMAKQKAHETYLLLHACIAVMNDYNLYTNRFHSIANQIIIWGGMEWMNEYYWNNAVKKSDNWFVYREDIYNYCKKFNPEIFYCNQLTETELYDDWTREIKFNQFDREIVRIIKRNSNLHKTRMDIKIENEVRELPFVYDVNWERCFERNCIYPAYYDLTVKLYAGDKIVERNYSMNGAEFKYIGLKWKGKKYCGRSFETNNHKLVLTGIANSPGFIESSRAYCLKKELENRSRPE